MRKLGKQTKLAKGEIGYVAGIASDALTMGKLYGIFDGGGWQLKK